MSARGGAVRCAVRAVVGFQLLRRAMDRDDDPAAVHEEDRSALLRAWLAGSEFRLLGADTLDEVRGDLLHLHAMLAQVLAFAREQDARATRADARAAALPAGTELRARWLSHADTLTDVCIDLEVVIASALGVPVSVPNHPPAGGPGQGPRQ